ncbi:MAG: chromosome segregation protein SMC, partial [Deltaproteobacteria bacterium]|nr:chromosome segregation protein SMC [Deltaproteobacteria bacterium]
MKLKNLEIHGFKSFVDKTVVHFDKDVTAIVGPNGCGKSNIVDAVRWVMGEQSAKHLRGRNMEDVIFSGAETRAPLSMAHVELTFSTSGYQTPPAYANYSEISIGRRLYRTGEGSLTQSEYFINKAPARLKDITDLFLGTGVGTKAYSIIEQGRISQVVSARPDERRFYIEEAAGVSKFKARKEAALRKIESTRQNLLRLTDVIAELTRQVNTLDRQAKKAEKYRAVKQEFQKWDLAVSSHHYARLAGGQTGLEEELKALSLKAEENQTGLNTAENHLEAARTELVTAEQTISRTQNDLFELNNLIQLGEADLRYKKEEEERLKTDLGDLDKLLEEYRMEEEGLKRGLEQVDGQKMTADLDIARLEAEVEEAKEKGDEALKQVGLVKLSVEERGQKIHEMENRAVQIEALKKSHREKQEAAKKSIEEWEAENEKLARRLSELQKVCRSAAGELESLRQMKLNLSARTDQITAELNTHRENLKRAESELMRLKEELTQKKSRLDSLDELQKNFEGYQEGTRAVLMKKRESGGEGIFGTVADFVETEPQYEGAVSAVLGEKLQYVVVKSQNEGVEAAEYLKTAQSGRSTFVPVNLRDYGESTEPLPEQEGVLGPMARFVTLNGEYEGLKDFLFGDIYLVSDLRHALDIWSANGHRKTLVTLNGEVVAPSGVISGGTLENTAKALLEKKREMKELAQIIDGLRTVLAEKERLRGEAGSRVEGLETSLSEARHSSFEEEIKIANQEKDVAHFKEEIESLK